ncbi:MAG: NAD(P)H-dependent oxidoreductase [Fimbriimonadaceae bacterium]|nr:NAD(P)H-dependent oxidoreductase [Alphaproteobacteria bacterium]
MTERVKILCFAGSARAASLNKKLAKLAAREAEKLGAAAKFIDLADFPMPLYDGDLETESGVPDNAKKLKKLFQSHHGIFISSPEYNAGYSPLIKNTLDWITRIAVEGEPPQAVFKNRVFAISSASPGVYGGIRALPLLRHVMTTGCGALVIAEQVALAQAGSAFDDDGNLRDERFALMLRNQIARLIALARHEKTAYPEKTTRPEKTKSR